MNEIQRSIIDAIKVQVNEKIKNLQFDKTCYGKVVTIRDNICDVEINGEITQCKIRNGLQINVNDIVLVRLINNDFSNKFVDAKLGTVGDDVEVEVDWSDIIGKPSSSPSDIDDSVSKKHTHNNLSLLETITQTLVNAWNSAVSHISDAIRHITSSERDLWNTVSNKVDSTEVVTTASPNKILKLDSNSKLPASITGNADGNASTATKLQTARTISLSGDVTGLASFDGSADASITTALSNTGVTAGTYTKVTVDTKGRVTTGTTLSATDIPNLDWSKITTGKPTTLSGYGITDAVSSSDVTTTPTANKILKLDVNAKLPASITGNADGNAATATKLQTARTISLSGDVTGSANFDGSSNITINATVVDDSHNHIISNVDGLQVALDGKSDITHNHNLANLAERNYTSLVGRPADDDFHTLTALLDSANDDELVIYDVSDSSYKKITRENLLAGLLSSSQFVFIRKKEEFTATEGQTVFNLTQGSYEVGTGRVDVYIWGNKQPPSAYTETSSTNITLVNGVEAGTKVLIEYIQVANVMDYIHAENHKIGGSDPLSPADIGAANEVHTHSISDITNLQTTLNNKVDTSEVTTTATANKILKLNSSGKLPASITGNADGNANTATKLQTARTITLSGDVSGSASFDGSSNITISATVADDSHNHVISNIDNLQTTLDSKAPLASPAFTGIPTAPTAPNGTNTDQIATTKFVQNALSAGGYGDMLKSQYDTDSDGIVDRAETADKLTTARTISLSGDVVGSTIFDGSADISINTTRLIKNNSFILDSLYTFTRSSTAYLSDGTLVNMNLPRFEPGKFSKAVMVEEGTENLLVKDLNSYTDGVSSIIDILVPNKVWAKRITVEANKYFAFGMISVPAQPNTKYTLTYWARLVSGSVVRGTQIYIGSNSQGTFGVASLPIGAELTSEWKKFVITGQTDVNATTLTRATFRVETNTGCTVEIADWQLEAKPYPTSFTDGTRAAETLTIPTEGVLNPQEGEISVWAYVTKRFIDGGSWQAFLYNRFTGGEWGFYVARTSNAEKVQFRLRFKTFVQDFDSPISLQEGDWIFITLKWDVDTIKLLFNGVVGIETENIYNVSFADITYIGSARGLDEFANTLFDDLRISNRARTDAEILAAYQSNEPLPYDAYTTWLSRFDNNYGLIGNSSNQIPVSNGILCTNLNAERTNGIKITASTTAPTSPQINDIWIDLN